MKMFTIKGKTGEWELVIGLETHIEVLSNSKLFSGASADYNPTVPANTQVSFVDAAMPGMLPVLNEFCVEQAIRMGLGLNAEISRTSKFARKQYFYPDLPQGYQISQPAEEPPVVGRGWIEIMSDDGKPKKIFIERAHLEQDAGKLKHDMNPTKSFADYNRTGVALLEIVTFLDIKNPENNSFITSPDEAETYLREIRDIARALDVSNANMEEGSMRADVNVSVRRAGTNEFGTRTETKNMVSFKFIKTAIEYEARRQIEILENGGTVSQDTMRYNQADGTTSVMRSKEDALDYRYFPDPDLLPLIIEDETIENIRKTMPELPAATRARYVKELGLTEYDAARLTETVEISNWFESAIGDKPTRAKPIANWIISELFAHPEHCVLDKSLQRDDSLRIITPSDLAELVDMIATNDVNGKMAKDIFIKMLDGENGSPKQIAEKFGLKQMSDNGAIESVINEVIAKNAPQVEQYKSGKVGLIGFFVGAVMKATGGTANPEIVNKILKDKLS
ncbi:MAG: Asp-tRNA(Asn)/Glu-tRNA(Gln) amidotransferase subunit GatB [Alphaproteobacteria bacterium]|nr:Asp-tRNA(Asn)/Glu-tRNA(Gln) amidotransferase subunit GatB [Alphaproteobacteria bacterium]MBN2675181.1 Asp-tRNA(Asn)/Glu-tRNA(Gln) amidotransferase subunit GatB [Alphaproteobacteria bacterium]